MPEDRIAYLPAEDNWWAAGPTGPCGPDTEIFYYMGKGKPPAGSNKGTDSKMWMEIWNNVFMQYNRVDATTLETLPAKCVDTGMGIERCTVTLNKMKSVYDTDLFVPVLDRIREIVGEANYVERSARIIADHLRAGTHMIADSHLSLISRISISSNSQIFTRVSKLMPKRSELNLVSKKESLVRH
jgi:alanyl-tRNA synthetase